MHSHSYTGNPLACAIACESLNIFHDENVLENNRAKAKFLGELAGAMAARHPYVGEFRQLGMVGALELVADKASKKPFDWKKRVGYQIYQIALRRGLLLRPLGNVIYFMPPYVIGEAEIESMINGAFRAIDQYFG
jgi:adenosylmethionine-8-amino-7-oxononanoate aminotransferase